MSVNLLSMESAVLGGDFTRQASAFLGESESKVSAALKAFLPAVLGGFMKKGATPDGAESLLHELQEEQIDTGLSSNPSQVFSSRESDAVQESGHRMLDHLFGERLDPLTDAVASVSGMSRQAAGDLMDVSSPVMFSVLKKQANEEHLDAPGLMGMLSAQGRYVQEALDSRLLRALGFSSAAAFFGGVATKVAAGATAVTGAAGAAVASTASPIMRALPWITAAAAVLVLLSMMRACAANKTGTSPDMVSAKPMTGGAVATMPATAPSNGMSGGGTGAMANAGSGMAGAMAVGSAQVFFDTNSATINAGGEQAIMSAASGAKSGGGTLEITGYTDRRGSMQRNQELAKLRAMAVRAALINAGVAADKIAMKPPVSVEENVGSNDRARRVDIRYVKP